MKLVKCGHGHWFDEDIFSACPQCGKMALSDQYISETTVPKTMFLDENGTCSIAEEYSEPKEVIHLFPGTLLHGRYLIGQAVGSGGFGIVYEAWDTKLETVVAVKEFFVNRLMTRAQGTKEAIVSSKAEKEFLYRKARFLAEARTMARVGADKNFVRVFEFFDENNTAYIVMEFLTGISLAGYLKEQGSKMEIDLAVMIADEVAQALSSLHKQGVLHCDVAPDNIFLCSGKEVRVKLMDLGAAKLAANEEEAADIILKPGFSAAEQYDKSRRLGPWTDIYALGATLYIMLTGIKPDESTNRKIRDEVTDPIVRNPLICGTLNNTVMKAMAVEPHMRFQNVEAFLEALHGNKPVLSLEQEKKRRRAKRFSGIAASVLILAVAAVILLQRYEAKREEGFLKPAEIAVWFSCEEDDAELEAMRYITEDFKTVFPDVVIDLKAIPENEYEQALLQAAEQGELPQLFESSDLPDVVLEQAMELDEILHSEQAEECLFLDQYDNYYPDRKKLPLAIEAPVAFAVTAGAKQTDYKKDYFSALSDFEVEESRIAADVLAEPLVCANFGTADFAKKEEFLREKAETSPVLLSSTMQINEMRNNLTGYEKAYIYYDAAEIDCRFVYEWSMGQGNRPQVQAATRLLSWMLGNSYQSALMITKCSNGQIPVNKICFHSKLESRYYAPIEQIYQKFVFRKTMGDKN